MTASIATKTIPAIELAEGDVFRTAHRTREMPWKRIIAARTLTVGQTYRVLEYLTVHGAQHGTADLRGDVMVEVAL